MFIDVAGLVDPQNHTVLLEVKQNTNLSELIATYTLSDGALANAITATLISDLIPKAFSSRVVNNVTAEAGNTQDWTVSVSIPPILQNIIVSGSLEACYNTLENIEIINAYEKANSLAEFKLMLALSLNSLRFTARPMLI